MPLLLYCVMPRFSDGVSPRFDVAIASVARLARTINAIGISIQLTGITVKVWCRYLRPYSLRLLTSLLGYIAMILFD